MQFNSLRPKHRPFTGKEDRRRRFQEEKWLFGFGIVEFGNVVPSRSSRFIRQLCINTYNEERKAVGIRVVSSNAGNLPAIGLD